MLLFAFAHVFDATFQMLLLALAHVFDDTLQMFLPALAHVFDATLQMLLLALAHVLDAPLQMPLLVPNSNVETWPTRSLDSKKGMKCCKGYPNSHSLVTPFHDFKPIPPTHPQWKMSKTNHFHNIPFWTLFPNGSKRTPSSRRCHHVSVDIIWYVWRANVLLCPTLQGRTRGLHDEKTLQNTCG